MLLQELVRILHLGNHQVVPALRALGHDVRVAKELRPDLIEPGRPVDVRILHREIAPDAEVFLMADTLGRQTLAHGVEDLPIPRLYWAIDVHLNFFWQRHYGALFDLVLVAQRDYVPLFEAAGVPARWLPWGIDPALFHDRGLARTIDIAFVGVVDANRPKRAAAVAELRRHFGMVTFGADATHRLPESEMARVFGSAKIVFNESVLGDVNFRTFEAMACGALVLTEKTGNGLCELFTPGEHLAVYTPDDLLAQAANHLAADAVRERIGRAAAAAIAARHTMAARMATLSGWLAAGVPRRDTAAHAGARFGVAAALTIARGVSDAAATMRLAAEHLQTAGLGGGDVEATLALAEIMLATGRDEGALTLLTVAREAHPADPRAWLLAGEIERGRGRRAEATALFAAGVRAAAIPAAVRDEALAALAEPAGAPAWLALGRVLQAVGLLFVPGFVRLVGAGLPRTAFDYFVLALGVDPDCVPALEQASAVLELAGRHEFARPFRERLVRHSPADPEARTALARVLRHGYALTESAHHARIAALLAGDALPDGTAAERAAAMREAAAALADVDGTRAQRVDALANTG